mgnify:CR=1 FL=1
MVVNDFENRLKIIGILVILIIAVLLGRVGYMQIYEGE